MYDEKETLKREIEVTASALHDKLGELGSMTQEKVDSITDGVQRTTQRIQEGLHNLKLSTQIEKRPIMVVAGFAGAGLLAGLRFARRRGRVVAASVSRPSLLGVIAVELASTLVPIAFDVGVRAFKNRHRSKRELEGFSEVEIPGRPI